MPQWFYLLKKRKTNLILLMVEGNSAWDAYMAQGSRGSKRIVTKVQKR
jgi:hypothetical protein